MNKTVAIIGGGLGGLATACYLAKDGYRVTIYEKNDFIGGRAGYINEQGFHFDTGPTWYWIPSIFEKFFADFGKKPSDYYELERLDPSYRVFFGENEYYDIPAAVAAYKKVIDQIEPGSSQRLEKLLQTGDFMLNLALKEFLYKDYKTIADMVIPKVGFEAFRLGSLLPLDTVIKKNFKNPKLQKLVSWHSLFLGASPKNLPSLYSFMLNVDFQMGTWYPKGGIYKVVEAVTELAKSLGVTIKTNCEIAKLEVTEGTVIKAIDCEGNEIAADIFVANADYHFVETQLLEKKWQTIPEEAWQKKVISPSALVFYVGVNTKLKRALHHNYYFSLDHWDAHFDSLFTKKSWPAGIPSYYFNVSSHTDSNNAPKNGDALFILVPIASGITDTPAERESIFTRIMPHLEQLTETDIRKHLVFQKSSALTEQQELFHSYQGNDFALAQTIFQTGYFRPYNKSRKVQNLYYVGQYTHPGIGLPMVLISASVTSALVKREV